ncbi:hypothetical protein ACFVT1_36625 [Streptomyces sp. NPDC057963]|uniref:hypothetical protein n=1 Tax=Streptomyces sp. NPDC057963 TaxID=3346290 RepID=UPI0036EF016C
MKCEEQLFNPGERHSSRDCQLQLGHAGHHEYFGQTYPRPVPAEPDPDVADLIERAARKSHAWDLDEMATAPGATQTKYRVTYQRVGRHGGRNGSPAPAPLTVWAVTADGLAKHIAKDVRPYILSSGAEIAVDLEALQVAEGGAA